MKKFKHILLFSVITVSLTIIISCSKDSEPKNNKNNDTRRQVMSEQDGIEKDLITNPSNAVYIMRLDGKTLSLFEVQGGEETTISAITIDPSYYPPEDIKELKQGIVAYSKEDGYLRLENFTN